MEEKVALHGAVTGAGGFGYGVIARSTTGGVNYGVYGSAYGGTTNWAGYFPSGNLFIFEKLGIGTASPISKLHVKGAGFPNAFGLFDTDAGGQDAGIRFNEAGTVKSHLYHQASTNTLNLYGEGFSGLSVTSIGRAGIAPRPRLPCCSSTGRRGTTQGYGPLYPTGG